MGDAYVGETCVPEIYILRYAILGVGCRLNALRHLSTLHKVLLGI
jgi:hypothetical protein